jgi:serine/threonine protein kinase/formylglycine-generating enzyme required for sulfatase activity
VSIEKRAITDPAAFVPPAGFDEYRLVQPLGSGRMGVVYLAHDELLDRHVAVKFIPTIDDDALARFVVEARAAARLQHPNVATLYRVGQLEDRPYLIYEYVRGTSLDKVPRPIPADQVLRIAIDLTRGLAAAHRRGVLHRDIKPGNAILAETGEAKLLDFGVAKLVESAVADSRARATPRPFTAPAAPADPTGPDDGRLSASDEEALADLTQGQLLGTPYFMSPEAWRRGASERSDLFSLGLVLYELLAGKGPFRDVPLPELPRAVLERDARPLRSVAPAVPEALATVVDRCLRRDPAERFASADHLLAALEALRPSRAGTRVPEGNPYRGLRPFEPEHRAVFFGRQRAMTAALDRLRVERFLLVTGDSGVGKSSLCAAGILPIAIDGGLEDGRAWSVARMVPGRRPALALAAALHPVLRGGDTGEHELERAIRADPAALGRLVRKRQREHDGLLLYVDQLEELATIADPAEAAATAEAIAVLSGGVPGVRVLATARSDFLSRLEALPGFSGRVSRALFLLAPLGADEIREAVVGPAAVKNVRFADEATVDTLVASTVAAQGAMPLLQFALAELWERRDADAGVIPATALAELGGVDGALSRHADNLVAALLPGERAAARAVMLRLVTEDRTRARRLEDELVTSPQARAALDALVRGRLVVVGDSVDGPTYEIAHEALLAGWATLSRWLAEAAETRVVQLRVEAAAREWRGKGQRKDLLWGARQLAETAAVPADQLTGREREFLAASRRASSRARWVRRAAIVGVLVAGAGVWIGAQIRTRVLRDRAIEADLAIARDKIRLARAADADARSRSTAAFALFDAGDQAAAEAAWLSAVAARDLVDAAWAAAAEPIERALLRDGERDETRRAYAEVLFERALFAEREHQPTDELVGRMAIYDRDGELTAAWSAPGTLVLASTPPGATVTARAVARTADRSLGPPRVLGTTPLANVTLAPGSYVLDVSLAGRASVVDAVAIARDGSHAVAIDLPTADAVPAGFVYIPAGRSPFGSADEEAVRTFFHSVPMHEVETAAYLIAAHETTYGEWIEFLEALPPDERALRTPRTGEAGADEGVVALHRTGPGSWELQVNGARAAMDQVLRYPDPHPAQDWRRMPVTGVSFVDGEAYAAWLARTGKVPGARMCTELEWERAARAADDRHFPHGDDLSRTAANTAERYGADAWGPDAVGSHPESASPYGIHDQAGNVWDLVANVESPDLAAARGGSFSYAASTARIANRESPPKTYKEISMGLRICGTLESGQH